eukprot:728168-Prymnesium_polylepis.1
MHCVGQDLRCQPADGATCAKLISWGVSCRESESGLLDEKLDPSVCSPLCFALLAGAVQITQCDNPSCTSCEQCVPSPPFPPPPPPFPPSPSPPLPPPP